MNSGRRTSAVPRWLRIRLPMLETQGPDLGREDPLEKEMATHSCILTWEIPWKKEPVHGIATSPARLSA